jgi:ketol-acid reductoisomerase
MAIFYSETDADLSVLKGEHIAIIGYGNQGHAHAQNLRDSGVEVIIGQRPGRSWNQAVADGFTPVSAAEAANRGDLVMMMLPDETMAEVYTAEVAAGMVPGKTLAFCHGFNIHFGLIAPPEGVDVIMVSPKGPGRHVRSEFVAGRGLAGLIAVGQDATGRAWKTALAYAKAIGCLRACGIQTTFAEECESDLFGEQAVLCGGVSALIKAAFETLVQAGYQPEVAYFEVMHELALIVELLNEGGLTHMRRKISNTAEYGDLTRGPRVVSDGVQAEMRSILSEIRSGQFAREWVEECRAGLPLFKQLAEADEQSLLEKTGAALRARMRRD